MTSQSGQPPSRPPGMIVLPGGASGKPASKYDEAEFLVGGRGASKGEMDSVTFKMHEGYVAELDKWWRSKKFPYKTLSDIIRHAVVRHVKWFLPAMEGEVEGSLIHELVQIDEITARWKFHNMFVRHIEAIAEQVNATLAMPNGKLEVERMLRGIKKRIDSTRPSYHKSVYEKMFNDRFSSHLQRLILMDGESGGGGDDHTTIDLAGYALGGDGEAVTGGSGPASVIDLSMFDDSADDTEEEG